MRKNIAVWNGDALTPSNIVPFPDRYAPFVSINTENHPTERRVAVTVRNAAGEIVEVAMSREDFAKLVGDAQKFMLENP